MRPAASVREILDEANAQHNCVAGFIDKYASGQTDLWLMRKCSDPDRPLVTVEVRGGAIRQAFQSHNRQVTAAQRRFLSDWCEVVGYRMPTGGRMRALGAEREAPDTARKGGADTPPEVQFPWRRSREGGAQAMPLRAPPPHGSWGARHGRGGGMVCPRGARLG